MALKFDITADSGNFVSEMQRVQQSFETATERSQRMSEELDTALTGALDDVRKKIGETDDAIRKLVKDADAEKELRKNTEDAKAAYEATEASIAGLNGEAETLAQQMRDVGAAMAEAAESGDDAAFDKASATYDELSEKMQQNKTQTEALTEVLQAEKDKYDELSASVAELDKLQGQREQYVRQEQEVEQTIDKVNEARKRETSTMAKLMGGQEKYNQVLGALPPQLQAVVGGIGGMTKAALAFIATPLGMVIAALGLALKALMSYFKGTSEGEKQFAQISGFLSGVMAKLNDAVIEVGRNISKLFTEPKQALKDFGNAIVENILNRFRATINMMGLIGDMFKDLFSGDWDKLGEDFGKFGDEFMTMATGVEDVTDKLQELVETAVDTGKAFANLAAREKELAYARRDWLVEKTKLEAERNKIMETMSEGTLDAQLEAAKKAMDINNRIAEQDKKLAQEAYDIIKYKNSLASSTDADYEAEAQAQAELAKVEAEQAAHNRRLQNNVIRIEKQIRDANLRLSEAQAQALLDIQRKQIDNEMAIHEATVSAMADGYEKERAQRELEYKKSKLQIERQQQDEVKAARDAAKAAWEADTANTDKSWDDALLNVSAEDYEKLSDNDKKVVDNYRAQVQASKDAAQIAEQTATQAFEKGLLDVDLAQLGKVMQWKELFQNAPESLRKVIAQKRRTVLENMKLSPDSSNLDMAVAGLTSGDANMREQGKGILDAMLADNQQKIDSSVTSIGKLTSSYKALKEAEEMARKAEETDNPELAEGAIKGKQQAMKGFADATNMMANGVKQAAVWMKQLAEATDDADLADAADKMGSLAQNFSAAAQGAASGGWIGAIVGGVTDIANQIMEATISIAAQDEQMKQFTTDFANQIKMLRLTINDDDYKSIFGTDEIAKASDAYSTSIKALAEYRREASKLGNMMVKTKDYSGISSWFKDDEYTRLRQLAPQLWGSNGVFDVDAAKAFLETNKNISETQRKQIQNVIDLNDAYEDAKKAVEEYVSSLTQNIASDLTTAIFDSVRTGANAWSIFEQVGSETIDKLGKQLIQEKYVQAYLDQFSQEMTNALGSNDPTAMLASVMQSIYQGLPGVLETASEAAQMWDDLAETYGFDMSNVGGSSSATTGMQQSFTQDSVDEANGRMAAIQMAQQRQIDEMERTATGVETLIMTSQAGNECLSDMRDLAAIRNGYLSDIYERMGQMNTAINGHLQTIEQNTSNI